MKWSKAVFALVWTGLGCGTVSAAPGDIYAEIAARPAFTSWNTFGHAWVCIAHHLNSGIKEDCYGFYPSNTAGEGIIGGSDLANEFKKDPAKIGLASWSMRKKITVSQYRSFQGLVNEYNGRRWTATSDHCGDFVRAAAARFGWSAPPRQTLPSPWVKSLVAANILTYRYSGGEFRRSGTNWIEQGSSTFRFADRGISSDYQMIFDSSRNMSVRLPLKGGMAQWQTTGSWNNLRNVTPAFE